jgi:hypothetical protein
MLGSSTRNRGPSGGSNQAGPSSGSDQAGPSSGYKPLQDPDKTPRLTTGSLPEEDPDKTPRLTTGSLPGEVGQHDIDSGREGGREEKAVTLEERKWTMSGSNVALHFYEY